MSTYLDPTILCLRESDANKVVEEVEAARLQVELGALDGLSVVQH